MIIGRDKMGTRCLTYVFDEEHRPIVCVFRRFDGHPEGHGEDLKSILMGIPIVDGLPLREKNRLMFNGMGELAALLVYWLKDQNLHGNVYLVPPVCPPEDYGQEYIWVVLGKVGECVTVYYTCTLSDDEWVYWFGPCKTPPNWLDSILG